MSHEYDLHRQALSIIATMEGRAEGVNKINVKALYSDVIANQSWAWEQRKGTNFIHFWGFFGKKSDWRNPNFSFFVKKIFSSKKCRRRNKKKLSFENFFLIKIDSKISLWLFCKLVDIVAALWVCKVDHFSLKLNLILYNQGLVMRCIMPATSHCYWFLRLN